MGHRLALERSAWHRWTQIDLGEVRQRCVGKNWHGWEQTGVMEHRLWQECPAAAAEPAGQACLHRKHDLNRPAGQHSPVQFHHLLGFHSRLVRPEKATARPEDQQASLSWSGDSGGRTWPLQLQKRRSRRLGRESGDRMLCLHVERF